jgi:gamma-glutamyltranspeptidase/glutathione hydrolase
VTPPSDRDTAAVLASGPLGQRAQVAVSPHHLASAAGAAIMAAGGNAVDGAIAVNAVLGVVLPDTCGPGGDLFALVYEPGKETPSALNASGRAGSGQHASVLRRAGYDRVPPRSRWSVTVPGCVDGWDLLLDRHGSLPLSELLAPAIDLAENGFPVSSELAQALADLHGAFAQQRSAGPLYPGDVPPGPGDVIRRPDLAQTLSALASGGRDAFYEGPVGAGITAATESAITPQDLLVNQAEWVTAISIDVFGKTGWTIPPNSQGYLTLATLWLFEHLEVDPDPADASFQHALIEAYRAVAWERDELVSDPDSATTPPDELLAPDRLAARLRTLRSSSDVQWPNPSAAPGGTAFMCTRDASGTGVALIQSNFHGIGSGLSAGDTGVFLHNRGAGFSLIAGHANEMQPGRRPLHTLSPTVWTEGRRLAAVLGTRGGHYQPQILCQVAANLFGAGVPLADAIAAPRWVVDGIGPGTEHSVRLEPAHGERIADELRARGHAVEVTDMPQAHWGPASAITIEGDVVTACADPRVDTASVSTA